MLTILGRPFGGAGFCDSTRLAGVDRLSRRSFLQIGGAAMGGLALNQILAMEAQAGVGNSHKAIINVYLPGGPPHIDMWDLKPEAPVEIRGEFKPIKTNVPGIEICELFPKIAAMMDKFVIVRSLCRLRRRPRRLSVHDRAQAGGTRRRAAAGRRAGPGCRGSAVRPIRPCRRTWP